MKIYNPVIDQLKQMEAERKKLLERVSKTTGFENKDARAALKAHDIAVGKLLNVDIRNNGEE